jgi:thiamine biosynthesis protein ThiC
VNRPGACFVKLEKEKLETALRAGTDFIMDLSTGTDLSAFRSFFLENAPVVVGAVPLLCNSGRTSGAAQRR